MCIAEREDVETRLDLSPSGVAKDESLIYSSTIKNLKFEYDIFFDHKKFEV